MFLQKILENAQNNPTAIAVLFNGNYLTYSELINKAELVASNLKLMGIKKNDAVILYQSRNESIIPNILGIFLSGGIYVPIDKKNPEGRLAEIRQQLTPFAIIRDSGMEFTSNHSNIENDDISYILFTSGSTGIPKGVCLSYENIASFLNWSTELYSKEELKLTLFSTSVSFDLSIFEIFAPLIQGQTVALVNDVIDLISSGDIKPTLINTVPSAINALISSTKIPHSTITINIAGEPLTQHAVNEIYRTSNVNKVYNLYGPTECTTYATCYLCKNNSGDIMAPIGYPISNSDIKIVDENLNYINSENQKGEILISGKCVGIGYFKNDILTNEKFISIKNKRFYKTGDIGFLNNGIIHYVGRKDDQVKIRGYRIELAEIEKRILNICGVRSCCVIYLDEKKEITACICSNENETEIKSQLRKYLPEYMVPTIKLFNELPINMNGKIDKKQLKQLIISNNEDVLQKNVDSSSSTLLDITRKTLKRSDIDVNKSFFDLGGHSLLAVQFLNEVKKQLKWDININDIFENISLLELQHKFEKERFLPFPWEEKFIAFEQINPDAGVYNLSFAFRFKEILDSNKVSSAVLKLQEKFPLLSSRFVQEGSKVYKVYESSIEKIQTFATDDTESLNKFSFQPFDFFKGSLCRFGLFNKKVLILSFHHCLVDGRSCQIILEAFFELLAGNECDDQVLISWNTDKSLLKEFHNLPKDSLMEWPNTTTRPGKFDFNGKTINKYLKKNEISELLIELKKHHCTISTFILAVYAITLSKFCRQGIFNIGIPFGNRITSEEENSIGCFVNTLPFNINLKKQDDSFISFMLNCRDSIWSYLSKQRILLEDILKELRIEPSLSHHPVFQAVFVTLPDIKSFAKKYDVDILDLDFPYSKFDCTLQFTECEEKITLGFEYATSILDDSKANLFCDLLLENIKNYKDSLDKPISDFSYTNTSIINDRFSFHTKENIVDKLKEVCAKFPNKIAVDDGGKSLTYSMLDDFSSRLANKIKNKCTEENIVIRMNPSCDLIIAIIAVLKAGKTYVPIDPIVPKERADYILKDSLANFIISDTEEKFDCNVIQMNKINLDDFSAIINTNISPDNYAYIIYTSGTTGYPKGVSISHNNVIRLFKSTDCYFNFNCEDTWCLFHSYGFDFSIWEIFGALFYGGKVCIPIDEQKKSPGNFYDFLIRNNVSVLNQTPSAFRSLLKYWKDFVPSMRYIISGGESLSPSIVKLWSSSPNFNHTNLINMYGITETTVHNTYYKVTGFENVSVIGTAIKDLDIYLVDENDKIISDGLKGEIIVAGDGVASGYFRKSDISSEKFKKIPQVPNEIFYKSGDLAIKDNNNNLVYLGRIDRQAQLRGYRIELAEIESIAFEYCKQQSVANIENINENDSLCLYIQKSGKNIIDLNDLRIFLSKRLPSYMIPNYIHFVNKIPINANGKIDTDALKNLKMDIGRKKNNHVEMLTFEEKLIKNACECVLSCRVDDITKNFFELGAHSLNIIEIAKNIESAGYKVEVLDLFIHSNIKDLAVFLQTNN